MTMSWLRNKYDSKRDGSGDFTYYLKCLTLVTLITAFVINVIVKYQLSQVVTLAIMAEKVRLIMKMYSFSRENLRTYRNMKCVDNDAKKLDHSKDVLLPTTGQFAYFLFAPTLIYKDNYPRYCSHDHVSSESTC